MPHIRSVRSGSIKTFNAFSALVRALLGGKDVLLKVAICVWVCHHVHRREQTLLYLATVACILLLRQTHGFNLDFEAVVRVLELAIGLNGLGYHFNNALPKLLVRQLNIPCERPGIRWRLSS